MGFLDDVRKLKQAAEEQPEGLSKDERIERAKQQLAGEARQAFETDWAPGAEQPFIEVLRGPNLVRSGATDYEWRPSVVEAYLRIVGLRPEDCFGIWPTDSNENGIPEVAVAYRDRPEYAQGRARFAAWREAQ